MPRKQYIVRLTQQDRRLLQQQLRTGQRSAWSLERARILLATDAGQAGPAHTDAAVAEQVGVAERTVARVRAAWAAEGLGCLRRKVRATPPVPPLLSSEQELEIAAIACTTPPPGYARWSLRLLADRVVVVGIVERISYETVRQTLKKTACAPGRSPAS